ncbi:CGNR zinc finger domain-containing protein [Shinella sp. CPCC 101442]|uniref:CGNR zinc finger domain-containing protein n=1 Tax=Shinella sp. CPCC 101442 TaxID=2932265 RepID=UPI00215252F0|nr:CGNR zinc finger domain-containing protein [Shinella sp. CPCC 101442]MCR6498731.1 CGNR zinc finger domain-containing protein [Shinella sp. CPCC 101442]
MTFSWTPHRFSGGALALDVANSVVLRADPERRIDRFADPAAMDAFPSGANRHGAERNLFGPLEPVNEPAREGLVRLREAIDRHFRAEALGHGKPALLADLLDAISATFRISGERPLALDTATARSALMLLSRPEPDRLKICPNCNWLFLDRSRNRSRAWCDMAVCGNRVKANRHYRRNREEPRL